MKIAHVIPYFLPARVFGGPVTALYALSQAQLRQGHEVIIYTTNAIGHGNFPSLPDKEVIEEVRVRRFKTRAKIKSYFFTPGLFKDLIKADYDVAHAHGIRNFQTDTAALSARLKKKPLVLSLHGMFSRQVAETRGARKAQKIYDAYDLLTGNFGLKTARILVANSEYEYQHLPKFQEKTRVVPHGVNAEKYSPQDKRQTNGKVILYVGRLSRGKNIEVLIRVFKELKKDFPIKLVIVGGEVPSVHGSGGYKEELLQLVKKLDVENSVVFTGYLNEEDLIRVYNQGDVFVNPSAAENFCMALLEASSCGLPVISTRVGIAPELLKEYSWLLFRDEKDLKETLEKLLENETLRKRTGRELRKKVAEEYSWESTAKKIENVYREALAK